ncbi:putative HLYB/MSBA FAMILY ABC TRANSPORTER [Vibrio nigripulchritudo MADA3029]|uniref:ABC transporter ATP-binding protein n=1 Tax=Vibrio nigripulchritudo TaxID=28173 RepID=UPI0003B2304D|nr:ABC transporter ATP-binding protein [Vibrio nigripulchritudo]CCN49506.1 putative HLYB/MSBA FAMILY ABC TRANSPORTER [Vibrio nigripulchritudo MADA3020]CCN51343.1 putative HLYB/MSBA FAMILY ABC TRANSPORTER [Vibrio nigripulchritudo MADA3021]CCN59978.1 putative HLYB/MSBA FAMILY ABC TRANSPORTER [Vibrio nigripulchritudo MADA3029]
MLNQMKTLTGTQNEGLTRNVLVGFCEALLMGLPFVLVYLVVKEMFSPTPDLEYIWVCCAIMALLFTVRVVVARSVMVSNQIFGYDAGVNIRRNLAAKLKRVPMGYLLRVDPGSLNSTMLQDVTFTEQIFSHLFSQLVITISLVALVAIGLTFEDWRLSLAMCIGLPIAIVTFVLLKKAGAVLSRALLDKVAEMTGSLMEYILSIKLLKAYNLAGKRFSKLDDQLKDIQKMSLKHEFVAGVAPLGFVCLVELGFATMLLTLVYLYVGGDLQPHVAVLFMIVSSRFFRPLMSIAIFLAEHSFMQQAANRIQEVLDAPELPQGHTQDTLKPTIEFDNVSFMYAQEPVLNSVSFRCEPGTLTALVGPSGSGKTTITSLIARFWDAPQGQVRIGDHPVDSLTAECLADHISMVFQDVYLFHDTIFNNITIGMANPSREQVEEVCKATCCWDFICELPDGLDSMIGEGGATLSGGEKQRLSIARAILKDAPIVLLDEATASLDPENEYDIQQALNALIKNKTVIMIAHRLNTIVHADQILVLDNGSIVERGKHQDLLESQGLYCSLWEAQRQAQGWKMKAS